MTWAVNCWSGMGSGGDMTIVNDGILTELSTMEIDVDLQDSPISSEVLDSPFTVELGTPIIEVEIQE